VWGTTDSYVDTRFAERLAARLHGELVVLDCGHWWQMERPADTAAALERLWARG